MKVPSSALDEFFTTQATKIVKTAFHGLCIASIEDGVSEAPKIKKGTVNDTSVFFMALDSISSVRGGYNLPLL